MVNGTVCLSDVLTVLGGLAEIGGLGLVVVEIAKVQRRDFPEHRGWVRRALAWLRRLLRHEPRPHVVNLEGTASATGSMSGKLTVEPAGPPTLQERLKRLERGLEELRQLGQQDKAELRREIAQAH